MRTISMLNEVRDGYFHEFVHDQTNSYGVIEFLDGKIELINIKEFKFKEPPYPDLSILPQPFLPQQPLYQQPVIVSSGYTEPTPSWLSKTTAK